MDQMFPFIHAFNKYSLNVRRVSGPLLGTGCAGGTGDQMGSYRNKQAKGDPRRRTDAPRHTAGEGRWDSATHMLHISFPTPANSKLSSPLDLVPKLSHFQ